MSRYFLSYNQFLMVDKHCEFTHLKMGWDRPVHLEIGRPILKLSAKLRILKWASDNLKIGEILSLAPTSAQNKGRIGRAWLQYIKLFRRKYAVLHKNFILVHHFTKHPKLLVRQWNCSQAIKIRAWLQYGKTVP